VEQTPSVGRVVHYVSYGTPGGEYGKECRAAIITEVSDGVESDRRAEVVSLCVLNPTGMFFNQGCRNDEPANHDAGNGETVAGGTWHWPERV
jgi:hypothetical protein